MRKESIIFGILFVQLFFVFQVKSATFRTDSLYSKWIIDSRMGDFRNKTTTQRFLTPTTTRNVTWDYVPGLVAKAIIKAYEQYKTDSRCAYYFTGIQDYADNITMSLGQSNIDDLNAGKIFFELYRIATEKGQTSKATTYKTKATTCRNTLKNNHYRIGGSNSTVTTNMGKNGFWHKASYVDEMWLDGLYMGPALYAEWQGNFGLELGTTDNTQSWDDIALQFDTIFKHTWDPVKKLNYHAWSAKPSNDTYWANQTTGTSAEFWGRGMGWFFAALVDVLEYMPSSHPGYTRLVGYVNQVADGLKARQDVSSGCWYQLLQYDNTLKGTTCNIYNYLESSASSMFAYAYLKGMRLGVLDKAIYGSMSDKAYKGIISNFVVEESFPGKIKLIQSCTSAGLDNTARKGDANYYLCGSDVGINNDTEGKVLGPFIMASLEYEKVAVNFSTQPTDNQTECIGGSLTLGTVAASNTTSYQWYSNTTKSNTGGTSVGSTNGGNTATFTPTSTTAGTFYYYCVATNGTITTASNAVQITINPATTISGQSTSGASYVQNASSNALTVTAAGTGTLSYQWRSSKDASTSTSGDDVNVGTNSNSFTPSTATVGTKYYYCVVSGTCGSATSAISGAITITSPCAAPVFTTQPIDNQSECIGGVLTLGTVTTDDITSFQWYSNITKSNTGGSSVGATNGGNTATFTPPSGTAGTYFYYCVATSSGCSAASNAVQITVNPATAILSQSTSAASYAQNTTATALTVTAVGTDLSYQWYSSPDESTSTPTGDLAVGTNSNSLIPPTTTIGTMYYYCKVTGGCVPTTITSNISGAITITTPAPTISLTSGSATQSLKVNNAITNIVYTITNATGATVSGLPTGLSGNYSNGTFTISGTIGSGVTPAAYYFTVTATALAGYVGSNVTSTGIITVQPNIINILYLTAAATLSEYDTQLYPNLTGNSSYNVTQQAVKSSAQSYSAYSAYDLIIISEDINSGNAEIIGLETIDKPILSLKSFVYKSTSWNWGTPDNGLANNGTVTVKQPTHPIFDGITLTNGTLDLLSNAAAKGVQPVDLINIGGINVALAPKNASPYDLAVAIHDVPASVRGVANSKFLLVAIQDASYGKMTANALTLFNNAIDYLVNQPQFLPQPLYVRNTNGSWETSGDNVNWSQDVVIPSPTVTNGLTVSNSIAFTLSNNTTLANLTIASGSALTVPAGKQLTVTSSMTNSGTLSLLSDATNGTATIITPENSTVNANINQYLTYEATGRNWYISSPVTGATSNVVKSKSGNQLWSYTEANTGTVLWNEITNTTTPLNLMQGYIARLAANDVITFSGQINTGSKSITGLTRSGQVSKGFHLLGNPYPSYVSWADADKTNLSNTIWYRSKRTGTYVYQTYNATEDGITANGGTELIPPMQAFWVQVTTEPGSLTFNNNMRSHQDQSIANNRLKAPKASSNKLLRLEVSNNENADETVIYFNENASNEFDKFDSPKLSNNNTAVPEIFTSVNNQQLVINGLNNIDDNQTVSLGFFTLSANTFSIKASELKNFDSDTRVFLKDKVLNAEFDLTEGLSYNFYSDLMNNASRFDIMFRAASDYSAIEKINDNNIQVYQNHHKYIVVKSKEIFNGNVTVHNIYGQTIISLPVSGSNTQINQVLPSGIYFVKLNGNGQSATKKVVVN